MRFQAISLYLLIRSQSTYAVWAGFEVIKVKIEVPWKRLFLKLRAKAWRLPIRTLVLHGRANPSA